MVKSAVQLYVLRNVDSPLPAILEEVAAAGFDGVEFAYRLPDADVYAVRRTLEETGLEVAGAHVPVESLTDDLDGTLELYRSIQCDRIVVPVIDESFFERPERVENAAAMLSGIARRLDEGMSLHYHNHGQEFAIVGGQTGWQRLLDAVDSTVQFQLDIGLARAAGQNPAALFADLAGRCETSHFKDIDAETGAAVRFGAGDVDMAACMRAASDAGVEWAVYEGDEKLDDLADVAAVLEDARRAVE